MGCQPSKHKGKKQTGKHENDEENQVPQNPQIHDGNDHQLVVANEHASNVREEEEDEDEDEEYPCDCEVRAAKARPHYTFNNYYYYIHQLSYQNNNSHHNYGYGVNQPSRKALVGDSDSVQGNSSPNSKWINDAASSIFAYPHPPL
ncbi:hypothetical protein V2J09_003250 [Rumex salicifolius]